MMMQQEKWSVHTTKMVVEEVDVDFLGHMNNVAYARFFERARWQMLNDRNFGFEAMKSMGKAPVLLQTEIQYLREIKVRQQIDLNSWTHGFEGKVCVFHQEMIGDDEVIHAKSVSKIGLFDLQARCLMHPDSHWRKVCGEMGM